MKARSIEQKADATLEPTHNGYKLKLREHFHSFTEDGITQWMYDEYSIYSPVWLSDDHIALHFEEYIAEARKQEITYEERLSAVEDAVAEIAELIGEML